MAKKRSFIDRGDQIKDGAGKGSPTSGKDLTRIKLANKKATESIAKYETFFNSVVDALFLQPSLIDGFGNFVEVNDAACKRYGYTREEFLELSVPDITVSNAKMNRLKKNVQTKTLLGDSTIFETVHVKKNGEKFPVEINANVLEFGGAKYIMSVVRDISERVKVRKEAEASEALSKNIIQTALDGFLSITLEGVIVDVNESYCSMVDYSREELIGVSVTQRVARLEPKEIKGIVGSIVKTGFGSFIIGHTRRDGNIVDLHVNARRLDIDGGRIVAFLKDITHSKIEEQILKTRIGLMTHSDNKSIDNILQESIDSAEELTQSKIAFFHFLHADQKCLTLQMWSSNTLKSMCSAEGKGAHYNIDQAGVWVEAIRERKPIIHNDYNTLENRRGLPEGHAPIIRELVVPIFKGAEIVAIIGVGNKEVGYNEKDIEIVNRLGEIAWTIYEKKNAEEELKNSNYWLNESQRISNSGYYIFNFKESTWTTSPVLDTILGIEKDFVKTLDTYFTLIAPSHEEEMREYVLNVVIGENKPFDKQYKIKRVADGEERWVHGLGQTIYDNEGNPEKIVGTIRDITVQKMVEFDLIAAKEKAEESDKLKSTFLATMSHELRTPLNAVIGFSNLIAEGEDLNSIYKMNEYVSESGNRLLKIIESIFDISMLETKNAGLIKEEFTASEFFASITYTIRSELVSENKTDLKIQFDPDPGIDGHKLYTDRTKLTQLITNLVNNSIKYTEKGTITYGYRVTNGEVIFFVEDTGIGIPDEKLGIIFDKFRQVDETHTRSHSGVGLGLAICKEISTLMKGKLWVDSVFGKGSKFYFSAGNILIPHKE